MDITGNTDIKRGAYLASRSWLEAYMRHSYIEGRNQQLLKE